MSILADVFVALPAEALSYSPRSSGGFKRAQLKGLTNLEFGTLWAIMQGTEFDFDAHDLQEINNSGETWLFQFPASFTSDLAALNDDLISEAARPWAQSEELQCPISEAHAIIVELATLARASQAEAKGLFLWGST